MIKFDKLDDDDVHDSGNNEGLDGDADLARSSLTHLRGPCAVTVAARGLKNATLITLSQIYIYCAKYFLPNISCQRYRDKYIEILVYCLIWYGQNSAAHCHELK